MSVLSSLDRRDLGIALLVPAGLSITGLAVALWAGEGHEAAGFAATAAVGGALGLRLRAGAARGGRTREGVGPTVAIGWLAAAVLAAVPFAVAGSAPGAGDALAVFADPVNAVFESMSGLTSTGLTVTPDASALPASLQWWRSALQWVGAVGILTLAFALAAAPAAPEVEEETDPSGVRRHLTAVWGLYLAFTVAGVVAFWGLGMPAWEALNHGVTSIATGGFSVTQDSLAGYSRPIQAAALGLMALGAISFGVHYAVFVRGDLRALARSAPHWLLGGLLLGGGVLTVAVSHAADPSASAWDAAFAWGSALTTAGFSTAPLSGWALAPLLLLVAAMAVGGVSGSTTGGLKQDRLLWLLRGAAGRATEAERYEEVSPALRQLRRVAATLALGTLLLLLLSDAGWDEALFEASSALGTVGLSTGLTGPDLSRPARIVLAGLMWAGRLEILAVLTLVGVRARPTDA